MILPAISIQQPWAFLICEGGKDVENRTWDCPPKYWGQLVLVHAGLRGDPAGTLHPSMEPFRGQIMCLGGIVGIVRITGSTLGSTSRWAEPGRSHWTLSEARSVPFHPCKGRLGFFEVNYPHEAAL